jgi:hypothetical protein
MTVVTGLTAQYVAMRSWALLLIFAVFILLTRSSASAAVKSGGNGELRVTVTVVSSVGIMFGPNGEQRVVVANAPDLQREFESMFRTSENPGTLVTKAQISKPHYIQSEPKQSDSKDSKTRHSDSKPIRRHP